MDNIFLNVLHEEEMLDDNSLDTLKGGDCVFSGNQITTKNARTILLPLVIKSPLDW